MLSKISKRVSSVSLSGIRRIVEYAKGLRDVIFLNADEPDFSTPEHIREAAEKAIEEGFTHYTPIQSIPELREAIAEKIRSENGVDVDPNSEVLVTGSAQSAFFAVCQALIGEGDEVIMQDPFYPAYEVLEQIRVEQYHLEVKKVKMKEEFILRQLFALFYFVFSFIVESGVPSAPFTRMTTAFYVFQYMWKLEWLFQLDEFIYFDCFSLCVAEDFSDVAYELYFRHFVFTESI